MIAIVGSTLVLAAMMQAQGIRPSAAIKEDAHGVALSVGGNYRPVGASRDLQVVVAQQLSEGIGAMVLRAVAPKPTSVKVTDDGRIAVDVELYHLALSPGDSYLDANDGAMAQSLLIGEKEFAGMVEELAGPDAALAVRVAFVLTGDQHNALLQQAALQLYRDPEVRAAAASLVVHGIRAGGALRDLSYDKASVIGREIRDAAEQAVVGLVGKVATGTSLTSLLRTDGEALYRSRVLAVDALRSASASTSSTGAAAVGAVMKWNNDAAGATRERANAVGHMVSHAVDDWRSDAQAASRQSMESARTAGRESYDANLARGQQAAERLRQAALRRAEETRRALAARAERARSSAPSIGKRISSFLKRKGRP